MNYIQIGLNFQEQAPEPVPCFLQIPSLLPGFANTDTLVCTTRSKREAYCFYGNLVADSIDMTCPDFGMQRISSRWFASMLESHFEGIIAHATYKISAGKIEGINNKIKTIRRQGYGYPDDEYFFLKIFDASRHAYVRNEKSHKICD